MAPVSKASGGRLDRTALEGLTMKYAEHVAGLRFEDIPAPVVEKAKWIIRDSIGNQIAAGALAEPALRMLDLAKEWGGAPQCTVSGHGVQLPAPTAAMINAMHAHGVELDDAHGSGLIKAGSILVPSVFAAAELKKVDGRELIAALVAAYDVCIRIAKAINPGHRQRGYHTSGTVSVFGAAAAVARLLGGDAQTVAWAMGLAGMQSAGIQSYLDDPCLAKPFSPGKSAFNGVLAGVLASRGFSGPRKVFESREGFLNAYAADVDVATLVEGIGSAFAILEVGFKPHAACRYAHGPIDLAQDFYRLDGVRLEKMTSVKAEMSELAIRQASKPSCANLNVAMGSTEFSLALALAYGRNGLKHYWQGFKDRSVHDAISRVELVRQPAFGVGGRQAVVEVTLKGGRVLRRSSELPKGEPENPLTAGELEDKFVSTAGLVIDDAHARELGAMVMALDAGTDPASIPAKSIVKNGKPTLRAA
jgi:2-methylcitrate dehydratase PrpD